MPKIEGLCNLRGPDSMTIVEQGGSIYLITADEGVRAGYGDFDEDIKSNKLYKGSEFKMKGATVDPKIFNSSAPFDGLARFFNDEACDDFEGAPEWCADGYRMSIGSTAVDYSNASAPHLHRMIGFGGRGISVYKFENDAISLVWDSGNEFEVAGCAAYPWSHNSQMDEEYAPLYGELYNLTTSEKTIKDIEEKNDVEEDGW